MKKLFFFLFIFLILFPFSCNKRVKPSKEDYDALQIDSISEKYKRGRIDFKADENEMLDILSEIIKTHVFLERYKKLTAVYITLLDDKRNPSVGITVKSDGENITMEKGYDSSVEPFAVISVTKINIYKAREIFSDNKISEEEEFLISNLFLIPSLEAFFKSRDFIYFSKINYFKIRTPLFYTLENPTGFKLPPGEDWTKITIYEENGEYKIKNYQEGRAKMYINVDPKKTPEYFYIIYDAMNEKDFDLKVKKYKNLMKELIKVKLRKKKI